MVTDEDRAAVMEILADRGNMAKTSEVGWSLHPDAPNRWAAKCRTRALAVLNALEADGLVRQDGPPGDYRWARTDGYCTDDEDPTDAGPFTFEPDWCIAPSETLKEWMADIGMSAGVLAVACGGRERKSDALALISDVLHREALLIGHATCLAGGTGIPARFWQALEHNYRAGLAAGLHDASDT